MILVSTFWPVRGWAIKNVWIDVPMNTRDGMQTMGVIVDTTVQFTAVTAWVPTNLSRTWSSGTIPTGSSWPYGYAQRAFPSAGTFDITATYAGEVSYAQRVIAVDATITVSTDRIPIYRTSASPQGSVTITLTTSPLPLGMDGIPVIISRYCGAAGSAIFAGGGTTEIIFRSQTLQFRGSANSDGYLNMRIQAANGAGYFCVRTWPVNFRERTDLRYADNGILHFFYTWDSESGIGFNSDLTGIMLGDIVNYNHNWNVPPYGQVQDNPSIRDDKSDATGNLMPDNHGYPGFSPPLTYIPDRNFIGTQYYRFTDTVLDDDNHIYISGPYTITRNVQPIVSLWYYTISKSSLETTIIMP